MLVCIIDSTPGGGSVAELREYLRASRQNNERFGVRGTA
jgi:hypothetical protein